MRALPESLLNALHGGGGPLTVGVLRLGALGDILRALPALSVLRRELPRARLLWVVEDRWHDVLRDHPDLHGTVVVPRRAWTQASRSPRRWPWLIRSWPRFHQTLRDERIDLLLDFQSNLRGGVVSRWSGAAVRLGFDGVQQKEGNRLFNNHHLTGLGPRTSRVQRNLALVGALGLDASPTTPMSLPLADRGRAAASRILAECQLDPSRLAIVSPGASTRQAYKAPAPSVLARACGRLADRGLLPLVVHGPGEEQLAHEVVSRIPDRARLAPATDLPALAALLRQAVLFVGGDSGPMHLACAAGCPVVAIYGPTDPQVNTPWGVPFRRVTPRRRSYSGIKRQDRAAGFRGLDVRDLERAIDRLLDEQLDAHSTASARGLAPERAVGSQ